MAMNDQPSGLQWAIPEELGVPPDQLRLRLDFFNQAIKMTFFEDDGGSSKIVSAMDIAHALASELTYGTGLLPKGALWWRNTKSGAATAIYVEPHVRQVALQTDTNKPPKRYKIPLPGLIFICRSGTPPWVFAVKKKPGKESDTVYRAPLANVFNNGRSCPGSHQYPAKLEDMVNSFFISFFSPTADLQNRSRKFPRNIIKLWDDLNNKKSFPMNDLVEHGTIGDLMNMEMDR